MVIYLTSAASQCWDSFHIYREERNVVAFRVILKDHRIQWKNTVACKYLYIFQFTAMCVRHRFYGACILERLLNHFALCLWHALCIILTIDKIISGLSYPKFSFCTVHWYFINNVCLRRMNKLYSIKVILILSRAIDYFL